MSHCVHYLLSKAGLDYGQAGIHSPPTSSIVIASGELSGSFSVNIIDDKVKEENETFTVTLSLQSDDGQLFINEHHSFTITIIDDDAIVGDKGSNKLFVTFLIWFLLNRIKGSVHQ